MNRLRTAALVLTAVGWTLFNDANAQGRNASSKSSREKSVSAVHSSAPPGASIAIKPLQDWIRRLDGTFAVDGSVVQFVAQSASVPVVKEPKGTVQCSRIGGGAGMQCLLSVAWPSILESDGLKSYPAASEPYNTFRPAIMLFAVDPEAVEINLLMVDDHGIGDSWSGVLAGNKSIFKNHDRACFGEIIYPRCPRTLEITAKPDGSLITIRMGWLASKSTYSEFLLHRMPPR